MARGAGAKLSASNYIAEEIKSVRCMPQKVQMISLENVPSELAGIHISRLVNMTIIGPTQYPNVIRDALVPLLEKVGMPDPASEVVTLHIPLRHSS